MNASAQARSKTSDAAADNTTAQQRDAEDLEGAPALAPCQPVAVNATLVLAVQALDGFERVAYEDLRAGTDATEQQQQIEIPKFTTLSDDYALARPRANALQLMDTSDEAYLALHRPFEEQEKKAQQSERARIELERKRLRGQLERLQKRGFATGTNESLRDRDRERLNSIKDTQETLRRYDALLSPAKDPGHLAPHDDDDAPAPNGRPRRRAKTEPKVQPAPAPGTATTTTSSAPDSESLVVDIPASSARPTSSLLAADPSAPAVQPPSSKQGGRARAATSSSAEGQPALKRQRPRSPPPGSTRHSSRLRNTTAETAEPAGQSQEVDKSGADASAMPPPSAAQAAEPSAVSPDKTATSSVAPLRKSARGRRSNPPIEAPDQDHQSTPAQAQTAAHELSASPAPRRSPRRQTSSNLDLPNSSQDSAGAAAAQSKQSQDSSIVPETEFSSSGVERQAGADVVHDSPPG